MSSSWKICSYLQQWEQKTLPPTPLLVEVRDEFVANVVSKHIKRALGNYKLLWGQVVTAEVLEDELLGLDLFGQNQPYLVVNAQGLAPAAVEFLASSRIDWGQKSMVFLATKAHPSLAKCLGQVGHHHSLELPKFWQGEQLLEFFRRYWKLEFNGEAKHYFLESIELSPRHYFHACQLLHNEYPLKKMLTPQDLSPVLARNRCDKFALAQLLGQGKQERLYRTLLNEQYSFDDLRQAFGFLQSHVIKLLDPSYVRSKSRPSHYDQQVVAQAQKWRASELSALLQTLAELELASKAHSPELKQCLRLGSLRAQGTQGA